MNLSFPERISEELQHLVHLISDHLDDMSGFVSLSIVPAAYDPLQGGSGNIFPN